MSEYTCPVCGEYEFEELDIYDICPVCGWMDDPVQRADHDYEGGGNPESVNQAREIWKRIKSEKTA